MTPRKPLPEPNPCGCGGKAKVYSYGLLYFVNCQKCESEGPRKSSERNAILAWNRAHPVWGVCGKCFDGEIPCSLCEHNLNSLCPDTGCPPCPTCKGSCVVRVS